MENWEKYAFVNYLYLNDLSTALLSMELSNLKINLLVLVFDTLQSHMLNWFSGMQEMKHSTKTHQFLIFVTVTIYPSGDNKPAYTRHMGGRVKLSTLGGSRLSYLEGFAHSHLLYWNSLLTMCMNAYWLFLWQVLEYGVELEDGKDGSMSPVSRAREMLYL